MNMTRKLFAVTAVLALSACSGIETASRNAPLIANPLTVSAEVPKVAPSFNVTRVNVNVPEALKVSEANLYYPAADIVWREDVGLDRHAQVKTILETAWAGIPDSFTGKRAVIVDVQLDRFHSLTQKARYTVGGVHSIKFRMAVRDAETGEFIVQPYAVDASFQAYGGARALEAEREGQTQKVRIIDHLKKVLAAELQKPVPVDPALLVGRADIGAMTQPGEGLAQTALR